MWDDDDEIVIYGQFDDNFAQFFTSVRGHLQSGTKYGAYKLQLPNAKFTNSRQR